MGKIVMRIVGFNWDKHNEEKCQKHGLSIDEIEDFLFSEHFLAYDEKHSENEDRFIAFGAYRGFHLMVVFTLRVYFGQLVIRVISARYARKKEIESLYEKKDKSKIEKD